MTKEAGEHDPLVAQAPKGQPKSVTVFHLRLVSSVVRLSSCAMQTKEDSNSKHAYEFEFIRAGFSDNENENKFIRFDCVIYVRICVVDIFCICSFQPIVCQIMQLQINHKLNVQINRINRKLKKKNPKMFNDAQPNGGFSTGRYIKNH